MSNFLNTRIVLFWGLGIFLCLAALGLCLASYRFSYDYAVAQMPVWALVAGFMSVGIVFVALCYLLTQLGGDQKRSTWFVIFIFAIGFAARVLLMGSEPVLEDDYQRYLWDGGLVANGLNPYLYSPADVLEGRALISYQHLADKAYPIVERINHGQLRTIYPVGAQALFGFAHKLSPFSLFGWRLVILLCELAAFLLLLKIVWQLKRDEIWLAAYWWNPLVIKELINSAHMEAALVPLILLGVYAGLKQRFFTASFAFTLAASVKIWPALLLPLVWRRMLWQPWSLISAVGFSVLIGVAIIAPFIAFGLNDSSGLVAYAMKWKTNSAFFPTFEKAVSWGLGTIGNTDWTPLVARGLVGCGLLLVLSRLVFSPAKGEIQFLSHIVIMSLLIFLFSPAQFPWYLVWVAPFLVFYPIWGLILLVPLMALYYVGFALMTAGTFEHYRIPLAFVVWVPVWALLLWQGWAIWRSSCVMKNL